MFTYRNLFSTFNLILNQHTFLVYLNLKIYKMHIEVDELHLESRIGKRAFLALLETQ